MKKTLLVLLFAGSALNLFAQKSGCKADQLAEKPGVVIEKEFVNVAKMQNLSMVVQYITDLSSNQKLSALDFDYSIKSEGNEKGSSVSTLVDPDEVDAMLAFLQNLQDNITKAAAPKNYTEYTYQSLSGFEVGCYWEKNNWNIYVKVDTSDDQTTVELNKDDVSSFMSFLKQAKAKF